MSFAHPLKVDADFRESRKAFVAGIRRADDSAATWRICLFTRPRNGADLPRPPPLSPSLPRDEQSKERRNELADREDDRRGLGVPVTKKMEGSRRGCAGNREEGAAGGGSEEMGRERSKSLLAVVTAVARRSSYYLR